MDEFAAAKICVLLAQSYIYHGATEVHIVATYLDVTETASGPEEVWFGNENK